MGTGTGKSLNWGRRTALYRLYDKEDALLYIGIGFNPRTRYYHHAATKRWWPEVVRKEVEWYPDRIKADAAERQAILEEQPRYNVARMIEVIPPKPRRARPSVSEELADELEQNGRAFRRAKRAKERSRDRLDATIRRAAAEGLGPAEITRLIGGELTERTVVRVIGEPCNATA